MRTKPERTSEAIPGGDSGRARTAAALMAVDAMTAEVIQALAEAGVRCILLKGPAIASWLYPDGLRRYEDCDLLVDPARRRAAERLMHQMGFRADGLPAVAPGLAAPVSEAWRRGWQAVDLHSSFWGLAAPAEAVWAAFDAGALTETVARTPARVPSLPARLLLVALHAAHHGRAPQPLEDLERALERAPVGTWAQAHALARRLDGERAFAAALRLTSEGTSMAAALGLRRDRTLEGAVSSAGLPLSEGFERLIRERGARARLRVARAELFPSAEFMRWRYPLARKGPTGIAAAYLIRLTSIAGALARVLWGGRRRR